MAHHNHHHCACSSCDDHDELLEEHNHEHHDHYNGSLILNLLVIIITCLLLIGAIFIEMSHKLTMWQLLLVYLVPYFLVGYSTLREAAEGLMHGEAFNEHLLMTVATIGALAIGFLPGAEQQFIEAVVVMLFFRIGELFEGYAEHRSHDSISRLLEVRPDIATVERGGTGMVLPAEVIEVGDTIIIKPGERVPLDGIVIEGESTLNMSSLTGESMPRQVTVGDEVMSGCVNGSGLLRVRTTKDFGQSTASKLIELVEHAGDRKSRSETFIRRFARYYTPTVVIAAILLALLPPLFSADFVAALTTWGYRALMFLVVSCPCALVISVPLTFFSGLGRASRDGILIKGANFIDTLSDVRTVVFDKTGTLTRGEFAVEVVHPDTCDANHLLHLAAHVEHYSTHPIGAALRAAFPDEATDGCQVTDVEEVAGQGVRAVVAGDVVCVGNTRMMDAVGARWHDCGHVGTVIHVAINGDYAGHIVITDQLKPDSAGAVEALRSQGVQRLVMLTGDSNEVAADVAGKLAISEFHAELLPDDKVQRVEQLIGDSGGERGKLAFVGDGINDAPVLARADVGIAMGALGSDAAIEAADVVIMDDNPAKIARVMAIARRTVGIARQNVVFAIGVKVAVLLLAAAGIATMALAVFADVGVTVLAVLNAMRAMRIK